MLTVPWVTVVPKRSLFVAVVVDETTVPPLISIAPPVRLPAPEIVSATVTVPTGAVVPPTAIVPVVVPVATTDTFWPPFTATAVAACSEVITLTDVVAAAVTLAAPTPVVFRAVRPEKPAPPVTVLIVTPTPLVTFTFSTLLTVTPTGTPAKATV